MHLTQDHWVWFYSGVALGKEVCFGTAISWGQAVCIHQHHPTMQILYLVSIGRRHVPLHLLVWWPWLLPVSCSATRFCHCASLVVSVKGHHQTCLPLQESLTAHCIVITKWMPVFEGVLLHFNIFYCSGALAMTHFSSRIIPPLSVSPPRHIQAIDLLCFALTGSHWQMCSWHRHMLSIGIPLVHKAWLDDEFLVQPLVIYRTVLKKCHLSSGTGSPHVACLQVLWPLLLRNSIARVICPSTYAQDPFSLPTDLPLLLSLSLCNVTHLSCQQVPVCDMSNCMMWGTMRHKVQWHSSTSEAKGLSGTLSCPTPHFFYKTIATFEFELLALLGNNQRLSRILFDNRGHATMAALHPLS